MVMLRTTIKCLGVMFIIV